MKLIVAAVAALGALSGAAQAAQPGTYDWSGLWIGAHTGGVVGKPIGPYTSGFDGPSGGDSGLHAFYNFRHPGNWVFGPYVALPLGGATRSSFYYDATVNWAVVGGARLGYAFDRILPYIVGGYLVGQGTLRQPSGTYTTATSIHTGYTLGAGVDLALFDHVSVGVRYAHVWVNERPYAPVTSDRYGWLADSFVFTLNVKLAK